MTYVELHCHSNFSLLDGASSVEALVTKAVEHGMPALALTDHDAVYAAVRFQTAAQAHGIRPIFGAELTLEGEHHLTLLVQDARGWSNLCTLISLARHNAAKGSAALPLGHLADHTDGLIALSGCRYGEISTLLRQGESDAARRSAEDYRAIFGPDRFFIELQNHLLPGDKVLIGKLHALAAELGLSCAATNNVHYADPSGHTLQDVLVCIRHNVALDEAESLCRPNSEYALKSPEAMGRLFAQYPEAVRNTTRIADQCDFHLNYGLQTLPTFPTDGQRACDYLAQRCREGLAEKGIEAISHALNQLQHELTVIERAGLANYFLIVWDLVRFAREHAILCQGRGSAANSLVAYLLGISPVNPLEHHLVFERFLSDERQATPDIDIDFQADRREEVIQYVYQRYGINHAAMPCTFVTFRPRSAIRDIGKVLGLPPELLDHAASAIDPYDAKLSDAPGLAAYRGETWQTLFDLCRQIDGFPRHLGIHNGGMVVMGVPLASIIPTEPATMENRFVVQWDKEDLEALGLVKIDILGLRMLSAISDAFALIEQPKPEQFDDPVVYAMIAEADTVGVFQVESRAQAQVLPRLQPRTFNDLIVSISLIRPGPVQGDMVHPYLRRRLGEEPVRYPHPLLEPALEETLGVVLFQEQVLKVARDLAGFTAGQGELLRRALGSKRASEAVKAFHNVFLEGAQAQGVENVVALAVFDTLRAFGGYSFPKSHAAAFAVLVYQSAWLKRYHPAAFYVGLLNNQPMGFWSPAVLVNDAKRHDIKILPVDVNLSEGRCTLEVGAIRLGYNYVKGFSDAAIERVMTARSASAFTDLTDFCKRTQLPKRLVEHLILAGVFDCLGKKRRQMLWALGKLVYREGELELRFNEDTPPFPSVSSLHPMAVEHEMLGLSLYNHPLVLYRAWLNQRGILSSADLERRSNGQRVKAAGLVIVHQAPPTAKGFHFVTLEDEDGFINVIVRPQVYAQYRVILRECPLLIVEGRVERQDGVTNLLAQHVSSL